MNPPTAHRTESHRLLHSDLLRQAFEGKVKMGWVRRNLNMAASKDASKVPSGQKSQKEVVTYPWLFESEICVLNVRSRCHFL